MFKAITPDNYLIQPFLTHKAQSYTFNSGSQTNPLQLSVDFAYANTQSIWNFIASREVQNSDGIYQRSLYQSIKQLFYTSASLWSTSLISGSISGAAAMNWQAGGSISRLFPLSSSVWVLSLAQQTFGEKIQKSTFVISSASQQIQDDGAGRLYVNNTGSIVGNIFYSLGIAVLNAAPLASGTISTSGLSLPSASSFTVQFNATQTIYEHVLIATIEPFEFNYSYNPSAQGTGSGGELIVDDLLSGSLTPYVTTIGLYNQFSQLVAVAKVNQPIKRLLEMPQSFIIKLDA